MNSRYLRYLCGVACGSIAVLVLLLSISCAGTPAYKLKPTGKLTLNNYSNYLKYRIHGVPMELVEPTTSTNESLAKQINDQKRAKLQTYISSNTQTLCELYGEEYRRINVRRTENKYLPGEGRDIPPRLSALCLSGGGIRSATFNLGVLQALQELGVLQKIDYLSTVSGGGYIAGWYMSHHDVPNVSDDELFANENYPLRYVISNANYLVSSHASKGYNELAWRSLEVASLMPAHWICNGLFDFDMNIDPSLRKLYRKGLAHTFLENPKQSIADLGTAAVLEKRPFWILNAGLPLVDDRSLFRNQFGDNFEITPLYSGSDALGYVETESSTASLHKFHKWMQLQHAVEISGAAVSRTDLRSHWYERVFIDTFNADLGEWIPSWSAKWNYVETGAQQHYTLNRIAWWSTSPFFICRGTSFFSNWSGGHDRTTDSLKHFLVDGGTFENLAALAPVRRGCRILILSDCSHDPNSLKLDDPKSTATRENDYALAFGDLRRLDMRLRNEFGARLELDLKLFKSKSPIVIGFIRNLPTKLGDAESSYMCNTVSIGTKTNSLLNSFSYYPHLSFKIGFPIDGSIRPSVPPARGGVASRKAAPTTGDKSDAIASLPEFKIESSDVSQLIKSGVSTEGQAKQTPAISISSTTTTISSSGKTTTTIEKKTESIASAKTPDQDLASQIEAARNEIKRFGDSVVWVIYIKPSFSFGMDSLPISTASYKATSKEHSFPQETTTDQFYAEDQFTAYRELGYATIKNQAPIFRAFFEDSPKAK